MLFYLIALSVLFIDQVIKFIVERSILVGQSVHLIPGLLSLTHVRNTGAAFSLFTGFSPYLALVSFIIILGVIYLHHSFLKKGARIDIGLALVLGGSLGNLIDRLFRFQVVDYLDIHIWPVFNLADMMINLGVLLIIIQLIRKEKDASDPH